MSETEHPKAVRAPFPKCCTDQEKLGGIWWDDNPVSQDIAIKPGWVMIRAVSIPMRNFWVVNIVHCPYCGAKLPDHHD